MSLAALVARTRVSSSGAWHPRQRRRWLDRDGARECWVGARLVMSRGRPLRTRHRRGIRRSVRSRGLPRRRACGRGPAFDARARGDHRSSRTARLPPGRERSSCAAAPRGQSPCANSPRRAARHARYTRRQRRRLARPPMPRDRREPSSGGQGTRGRANSAGTRHGTHGSGPSCRPRVVPRLHLHARATTPSSTKRIAMPTVGTAIHATTSTQPDVMLLPPFFSHRRQTA